jgi:hypothetical protein
MFKGRKRPQELGRHELGAAVTGIPIGPMGVAPARPLVPARGFGAEAADRLHPQEALLMPVAPLDEVAELFAGLLDDPTERPAALGVPTAPQLPPPAPPVAPPAPPVAEPAWAGSAGPSFTELADLGFADLPVAPPAMAADPVPSPARAAAPLPAVDLLPPEWLSEPVGDDLPTPSTDVPQIATPAAAVPVHVVTSTEPVPEVQVSRGDQPTSAFSPASAVTRAQAVVAFEVPAVLDVPEADHVPATDAAPVQLEWDEAAADEAALVAMEALISAHAAERQAAVESAVESAALAAPVTPEPEPEPAPESAIVEPAVVESPAFVVPVFPPGPPPPLVAPTATARTTHPDAVVFGAPPASATLAASTRTPPVLAPAPAPSPAPSIPAQPMPGRMSAVSRRPMVELGFADGTYEWLDPRSDIARELSELASALASPLPPRT